MMMRYHIIDIVQIATREAKDIVLKVELNAWRGTTCAKGEAVPASFHGVSRIPIDYKEWRY